MGAFFSGLAAAGKWLLSNPAVLLCGVLGAAFVMIVVSKNNEIAVLDKTVAARDASIDSMSRALGQARTNVATLSGSLKTQNTGIAYLKSKADASDSKFDSLVARLAAGDAALQAKLGAIDSAKPGSDPCGAALDLIQGSAK